MKKYLMTAIAVLLALTMFGACGKQQTETPTETEPSAESTPAGAEGSADPETAAPTDPAEAAYAQQIEKYYTAVSNKWDEGKYFENEMCAMVAHYYEGNALDNVGYAFVDLNGDNVRELVIGAILNAENSPQVFEIWTLVDGEPVMLAQSGSRNRYYLQYAKEDELWTVAYEAENGAANHATYYLRLAEGKFEVVQGILFDAVANESAPWFMTYDLDWDVANDTPTDEATANAVMQAERKNYTSIEYIPYSQYK